MSDSELKGVFEATHQQTMDVLSAAGNLLARREAHGGYGTPSSYASEQELNLYFNDKENSFSASADLSDDKSCCGDSRESTDTGVESITTTDKTEEAVVIAGDHSAGLVMQQLKNKA